MACHTARPALTVRRYRWGGAEGAQPPASPCPGTREAWPQRVAWLSRLRRGRQARPPQPRTLRLNAPHRPFRRARARLGSRLGLPRTPLDPVAIATAAASSAELPANPLLGRDAALHSLLGGRPTPRGPRDRVRPGLGQGARATPALPRSPGGDNDLHGQGLFARVHARAAVRRTLGPERRRGLVGGVGLATHGWNCFVTISMSVHPNMVSASHASAWEIGYFPCTCAPTGCGNRGPATRRTSTRVPRTVRVPVLGRQ